MKNIIAMAKGFSPPWTEGSRNTLLSWLASLAFKNELLELVFTYPDYLDVNDVNVENNNRNKVYKLGEKETLLYIYNVYPLKQIPLPRKILPLRYGLWRSLVNLYLASLDLPAIVRVTKIVENLLSTELNNTMLILHNAGTYTVNRFLSNILRRKIHRVSSIVITQIFPQFANYLKLLRILNNRKEKVKHLKINVLTSSPLVFNILKNTLHENERSMLRLALPIPILGSVVEYLGITNLFQNNGNAKSFIITMENFIDKYGGRIALYIGELNQVRFPLPLLKNLLINLQKINAGLIIVGRPSRTTLKYVDDFRSFIKKFENLLIMTSPLDPWTKEKLFKTVNIVIFPAISFKSSVVVDPPLFILEAIYMQKPIISFQLINLQYLYRVCRYDNVRLVPPKIHEFVNTVIDSLKHGETSFTQQRDSNIATRWLNTLIDNTFKAFMN